MSMAGVSELCLNMKVMGVANRATIRKRVVEVERAGRYLQVSRLCGIVDHFGENKPRK